MVPTIQNTVLNTEDSHTTQPSWFPDIFLIVINLLVRLQHFDINENHSQYNYFTFQTW